MIQSTRSPTSGDTDWPQVVAPQPLISLWRFLRRPALGQVGALLGVILLAGAYLLPQLPGQLVDEPVAAARWLAETAALYGAPGDLAAWLGLFHVAHSPLLFAALMAMAAALSAQLAEAVAVGMRMQRLSRPVQGDRRVELNDAAFVAPPPLIRRQVKVANVADSESHLQRIVALDVAWRVDSVKAAGARDDGGDVVEPTGISVVATRHGAYAWSVILGPLGALLLLAATWVGFAHGVRLTTPLLAPGDVYRNEARGVVVTMDALGDDTASQTPAVAVHIGSETGVASLTQDRRKRLTVDSATVAISQYGMAAVVDIAERQAVLLQPGRIGRVAAVGLVLETAGDEATVLLPEYSSGLRLVAQGDGEVLLVELYRSDRVEPLLREQLTLGGTTTLPVGPGATLNIKAVPAIEVEIARTPGSWLGWMGLGLALLGMAARIRRPAFLVITASPWPSATSLTTAPELRIVIHGSDVQHVEQTVQAIAESFNDAGADSGEQG